MPLELILIDILALWALLLICSLLFLFVTFDVLMCEGFYLIFLLNHSTINKNCAFPTTIIYPYLSVCVCMWPKYSNGFSQNRTSIFNQQKKLKGNLFLQINYMFMLQCVFVDNIIFMWNLIWCFMYCLQTYIEFNNKKHMLMLLFPKQLMNLISKCLSFHKTKAEFPILSFLQFPLNETFFHHCVYSE